MVFYIYKITNLINDKFYIGQTNDFKRRFKDHIYDAISKKLDTYLCRAIRKYGKDNFIMEIIEIAQTHELVLEREIYWTRLHKYLHPNMYYNLTDGGEGRIGYKLSNEAKKKLSENRKGEKGPRFGKAVSKENKNNISEATTAALKEVKRKPHTEETKLKIKKALSNKKTVIRFSKEFKQEIINIYKTCKYTKQQLADKFNLKLLTIASILVSEKRMIRLQKFENTKLEIVELYKTNKFTKQQLADKFNLKFRTIKRIIKNYINEFMPEFKNKRFRDVKGENSSNFGKISSLQTRQNMINARAKQTIKPHTEETKKKISENSKKRDYSYKIPQETKLKIIELYNTCLYTQNQIADLCKLKHISVSKIITLYRARLKSESENLQTNT